MKRNVFVFIILLSQLFYSCTRSTGTGMAIGSQFGHLLGGAVGEAIGGRKGAFVGSVFGMAAGAMIGESIETKNYEKRQREIKRYRQRVLEREERRYKGSNNDDLPRTRNSDEPLYTENEKGDDRIEWQENKEDRGEIVPFEATKENAHDRQQSVLKTTEARQESIVIKLFAFKNNRNDLSLVRNESATLVVELYNANDTTLYNVEPIVQEVTHNKHILLSENVKISRVEPYSTIRCTFNVVADKHLKNGSAIFTVKVKQNNRLVSLDKMLEIETRKN